MSSQKGIFKTSHPPTPSTVLSLQLEAYRRNAKREMSLSKKHLNRLVDVSSARMSTTFPYPGVSDKA
ncbi:Hypothetical protein FKW44_019099 [Caligus rogercresseyi]|uniref:Uncharacterized protein n=1 Tax=Caligus rogercresseyi TaxID=217165 RepID=A0A7T8JXA6_CALRO|nr:Hypothetical protein FKW44_019099 [Caligus rogercresseyi]